MLLWDTAVKSAAAYSFSQKIAHCPTRLCVGPVYFFVCLLVHRMAQNHTKGLKEVLSCLGGSIDSKHVYIKKKIEIATLVLPADV